jgi:ATP-dependent helicase/nuclease subunit B
VPVPPSNVRRHFLSWDRPLLAPAVEWLARDWRDSGPLDLSRCLVIVPTRQSGRRLREALAEHAAARNQAVLPPRVLTPEALLGQTLTAEVATPLESTLGWTEIFRALPLDEFREVFPVDPPARNFGWALRLAREFSKLQLALAEGGRRLGDVAANAGVDVPEAARWQQLRELEARHDEWLAQRARRDPQAAKILAAAHPVSLPDVEKIVMLATPDPLPLALELLAGHARTLPVEIVIYAPHHEAENFDPWGRPRPEKWNGRVLALPDFGTHVHLCADPAEQAERVVEAARGYGNAPAVLGVGVADAEILPLLERAMVRRGVSAFNPEGRLRRHDGLHALLTALAEVAAPPAFEAVAALARCPDVLAWLHAEAAGNFSAAETLAQLDALHARHLPPTLVAAQAHAGKYPAAGAALAAIAELRTVLVSGAFPANAAAALTKIFAARSLDVNGLLAESAEAWTAIVREVGRAFALVGESTLTLADAWEFALAAFGAELRSDDREPGAIDLLGWLELLWEDAPHLIVAGLNDGRVPEAIVGDAFLPEALRGRLGLKTNAERFARDAYLLQALAASRAHAGTRLDLLLGKTTSIGDPLRPSRLLLRCPDGELPARVTQLFRPVVATRPGRSWQRAWQLAPRRLPPPARISVTALRDWLACPFRFYLRHVLKMERSELAKEELDARDFGTLVHTALQQLGENAVLRDCTDSAVLREFLLQQFELAARARYGAALTLPLVVQFESARQRLRAAAEIEAAERAAGWRTERVEWKFALPLGGLTISGKIDRIDRHRDGRARVLDYKTGDTAISPELAHWRGWRDEDAARPAWLRCADAAGKPRAWVDLQLPLYLRAVAAELGDVVECGYFNLPKAAGETAIMAWAGYSRDTQSAAERCAEGIASAVAAGNFWPPTELTGRAAEWDDFAELFHEGAAASIAWTEAQP